MTDQADRLLLKRYMRHLINEEGCSFLTPVSWAGSPAALSQKDVKVLLELECEIYTELAEAARNDHNRKGRQGDHCGGLD